MKRLLGFIVLTISAAPVYAQPFQISKSTAGSTVNVADWRNKINANTTYFATYLGNLNTTVAAKADTGTVYPKTRSIVINGNGSTYLSNDGTYKTPPFVPTSRTITINNTTYDLSQNRSWTIVGSGNGIDTSLFVYPELYGAVGDSTTNDRTSLQKSINICDKTGKVLILSPGKRYRLGSNLAINLVDKGLKVIGMPASVIIGNQTTLTINSSPSATVALTDTIIKGSTLLPSSIVVNVGDVLEIRSTSLWGNATNFVKGEIVEVRLVKNGKIYLAAPVYDNYSKLTTTVRKLNSKELFIDGVTFDGVAINPFYCKNVNINNCKFYRKDFNAAEFWFIYKGKFSNNVMVRDTMITHSYGVNINSSFDFEVSKNSISHYDQGILAGGHYPCRNLLIDYNNVSTTVGGGQIDCHPNTEFTTISNNIVRGIGGAIYTKGVDVNVINNTCILTGNNGVGIVRESEIYNVSATKTFHPQHLVNFSGNRIYSLPGVVGDIGIKMNWNIQNDTIEYFNISDNYINVDGYGMMINYSDTTNRIKTWNIQNNVIYSRNSGGDASNCFRNTQQIEVGNMIFNNNHLASYGSDVVKSTSSVVDNLSFIGNIVEAKANVSCLRVYCPRTINIKDNIFLSGGVAYDYVSNGFIKDNIFKNTVANRSYSVLKQLTHNSTDNIFLSNNYIINVNATFEPYNIQDEVLVNVIPVTSISSTPATTGTITVNPYFKSGYTITPTGDCTFNATVASYVAKGYRGGKCVFTITTSGTTSYTLTWGTNFRSQGALSTGTVSGKVFKVVFDCSDGNTWEEVSRTTAM